MNLKSKELGQVFTPNFVVDLMCENLNIVGKKILEPSCGDGAFLTYLARKYIKEFLSKSKDLQALKIALEQNLIGIDIDAVLLQKCRQNLNEIAGEFGLKNIKWTLIEGDFLELYKNYKGQIDIIVGNPPYIRIHNLNENARNFVLGGMSDLFLIFFKLGFFCLKNNSDDNGWGGGNSFLSRQVLG